MTVFGMLLVAGTSVPARMLTDSAGRTVDLPEKVERVIAAGTPAAVLLYVLAPDRLVGWPRAIPETARAYLARPYQDLPITGILTARGSTANLEVLLGHRPDLILDVGSVSERHVSLANRLQDRTGVPCLLLDGQLDQTPDTIRRLGEVLGVPERASLLAEFIEDALAELDGKLTRVLPGERPRVYLARTSSGLETGVEGSINTEIIERSGGINVIESFEPGRRGIVQISIEHLLLANPDVIITMNRSFHARVREDRAWSGIGAVREGRVYLAPTAPFGWIDHPPSLNRMIGLEWLSGLFHPERMPFERRTSTRDFYRLFYHLDLTDEDVDRLFE